MISLEFTFDLNDLTPEQLAAADDGALDPEQVQFQYICQTEDGGHDPEGEPDEKVRDSHRALHATVWRLDDPTAPIPPIGYGCRCGMRLLGKPDTLAEEVLGAAAPTEPTNVPDAFGDFLDVRIPKWKTYAEAAKKLPEARQAGEIYLQLRNGGAHGDLRELARMIMAAGLP